jgi:hypothetical protein
LNPSFSHITSASWDRADQHTVFGRLNHCSNTIQQTYYNRSTELNVATSLAEKMFTNYKSSLWTQHTVNQSFSVFYRIQYGLLRCHSSVLMAYLIVC